MVSREFPIGVGRAKLDVLIVEDEPVSRRALSALMAARGCQTMAARSAEDALHGMRSAGTPRVALVDLHLPGMSGIDFIRKLVADDPDVFAVLITAAGHEIIDAIRKDNDVNYLPKPLDFDRLLSLLSRAHQVN
jgi:two-component system response regulator (stage 0 sporulation protein F)